MSRDHAYELMRSSLKAVLPSVETFAQKAKSAPAKKYLMMQILQIKEALKAAEEAGPTPASSEGSRELIGVHFDPHPVSKTPS